MRLFSRIGLLTVLLFGIAGRAQADFMNGIVAIVNDSIITYQEVRGVIAQVLDVNQRLYTEQGKREAENQKALIEGIDQLVERQLILSDFKTSGGNIPESIIDEEIDRQIRSQFGTRQGMMKELREAGSTYEKYREQQRQDILVGALRAHNISSDKIIVSPHKIEEYYQTNSAKYKVDEQVKLHMIHLRQNPGVRKLAEEILAKIKEGASFGEMAVIHHEGTPTGGDWGWVDKTVLRQELSDAAFSLKVGENSGVIEIPGDGCYLVHVDDRRPPRVRPLSEVRREIEQGLLTDEKRRLEQKWIGRLKAKSYVRYTY